MQNVGATIEDIILELSYCMIARNRLDSLLEFIDRTPEFELVVDGTIIENELILFISLQGRNK